MSHIRINSIKIKNYRSFGEEQEFQFPNAYYKKPVAIVGYNNCGKTNLMNAILYGIGEKYTIKDTFSLNDFHNRKIVNVPSIELSATSSTERKYDGKLAILEGLHKLEIQTDGEVIEGARIESYNIDGTKNWQSFGASRHFNIFYINFHNIKDEICTQRTSWGNLKSFLAKHIKYLVDNDSAMAAKKVQFENETRNATNKVLEDSALSEFICAIKRNYSINLRDNNCAVEFGFPEYDDIFLQMMFKVGLNCGDDISELVPISHFGDGYISMFVMAVIQAISETDLNDKCLFLFEEPESFLHENHQDYFYRRVLCSLAEKGHQVIYTTHSDRMVDIFDTKGIIRLEFNEIKKQTVKKFNNTGAFSPSFDFPEQEYEEIIRLDTYNSFIKSIEPNLNKILFSRKVILVEGPNDVMAYKFAIERKVSELADDNMYAQTYLSFLNIAIVAHYGKSTALLLIELCKHLGLDYFVITDWDFDDDFVTELSCIDNLSELKQSKLYNFDEGVKRLPDLKSKITTNWNLINTAGIQKVHFNIRKLESVLGYNSNDKDSVGIWKKLNATQTFSPKFFPSSLEEFLEFDQIKIQSKQSQVFVAEEAFYEEFDDLPF
jgi:putative ATP-dependent endonuclease of the OLD family